MAPKLKIHWAVQITNHSAFQPCIIGLILLWATLHGIETNREIYFQYERTFWLVDFIIITLFVFEIIINIIAEKKEADKKVVSNKNWFSFFKNPWHIFDFIIVVICLLPHLQGFAVLRTVRILRVLLVVDQIPKLQKIVNALLKALPSMGYIMLLLFIHIYTFAIIGIEAFNSTGSTHFSSLGNALFTLFEMITGEGWVSVMKEVDVNGTNHIAVVLYFMSFVVIGGMIFLNLFLGVIVDEVLELRKDTELEDWLEELDENLKDDNMLLKIPEKYRNKRNPTNKLVKDLKVEEENIKTKLERIKKGLNELEKKAATKS